MQLFLILVGCKRYIKAFFYMMKRNLMKRNMITHRVHNTVGHLLNLSSHSVIADLELVRRNVKGLYVEKLFIFYV